MSSDMVILGEIVRPHGVRGEVKLRSFTEDPCAIAAYGALTTDRGEEVRLKNVRAAHDHVIARIDGVNDRDAAERLKGRQLQVSRDRLPELGDEDEEYAADLIDLDVIGQSGTVIGSVIAVQDFGAGDLLEVRVSGRKTTVLLPFSEDVVVEITDAAIIVDDAEGSVVQAFLEPVGAAPKDEIELDEIEAPANDNPPDDSGETR